MIVISIILKFKSSFFVTIRDEYSEVRWNTSQSGRLKVAKIISNTQKAQSKHFSSFLLSCRFLLLIRRSHRWVSQSFALWKLISKGEKYFLFSLSAFIRFIPRNDKIVFMALFWWEWVLEDTSQIFRLSLKRKLLITSWRTSFKGFFLSNIPPLS